MLVLVFSSKGSSSLHIFFHCAIEGCPDVTCDNLENTSSTTVRM